jgi:molybdopterin-guanine dinucleotide biosynthesis protein A
MDSAVLLVGPEGTPVPADADETETGSSLHRVADAVAPAVEDLVVACPDEQRSAVTEALDDIPHRLAVDPAVGEGPVTAIRAGARVATGDSVAVVAGHVPTVDTRLLADCVEACETAAVPHSDGRLYPLHAVYDRGAIRTACDRTLATGSRRLLDALVRLEDVTVVDAPEFGETASTSGPAPDTTTPASVVRS